MLAALFILVLGAAAGVLIADAVHWIRGRRAPRPAPNEVLDAYVWHSADTDTWWIYIRVQGGAFQEALPWVGP